MPLATPRTRIAFLLLVAALLLVVAAVVASVVWLHDPVLAAILATAGVAGSVGGGFAYAVSREGDGAAAWAADGLPDVATPVAPVPVPRAPIRIQSLPVADLPPAYLAAVMKGVHANRTAQPARVLPEVELRH